MNQVGGKIPYGMDANYIRKVRNEGATVTKKKKEELLRNYAAMNQMTFKTTGRYRGNETLFAFFLRGQSQMFGESLTVNQAYQKFIVGKR